MQTTYYALATINTLIVLNEAANYYFAAILYGVWAKAQKLFSFWITISKFTVGIFLVVSAVYYFSALYQIIKLANDTDGSTKINTRQLCVHLTALTLYLLAIFA